MEIYLGDTGFYQGRVFGETRSHVNAHIEDGLLTASIVTKEDSYHVEVIFQNIFLKTIIISLSAWISPLGDIYLSPIKNPWLYTGVLMLYLIMNLQSGIFGLQAQLRKTIHLLEHVPPFRKKETRRVRKMLYHISFLGKLIFVLLI